MHVNFSKVFRLLRLFGILFAGLATGIHSAHALDVGVGVHLATSGRSDFTRQLDAAAAAGFKLLRWDVSWKLVEKTKGNLSIPRGWDDIVDAASRRGIEVIMILDYGNKFYDGGDKPRSKEAIAAFTRYATEVSRHFKGRVRYYEIWNEWDFGIGNTTPGTPEDLVALCASVYPAIKAVDPNSVVIVGGTADVTYNSLIGARSKHGAEHDGFFERLIDLGLLKYGDALSVHPYVMWQGGEMKTAKGYWRFMQAIVERVKQATSGSKTIPIFVTEIGWPTSDPSIGPSVSLENQAAYLTQVISLSRSEPLIAGVVLYELRDGGRNRFNKEENFGLLYANGLPKPAYTAVQQLLKAQ